MLFTRRTRPLAAIILLPPFLLLVVLYATLFWRLGPDLVIQKDWSLPALKSLIIPRPGAHSHSHLTNDPDLLADDPEFLWGARQTQHRVSTMRKLPLKPPLRLPRVQAVFREESRDARKVRSRRQAAVKQAFAGVWDTYVQYAWMKDELLPVSNSSRNTRGGWATTLIDSLDMLWLTGMRDNFALAVDAVANISFETTTTDKINVLETNGHILGGLLSAYDLSGHPLLLKKAKEVGEMLYAAFDTPNRMPVTHWNVLEAADGKPQTASERQMLSELASYFVEFTRLSLLTGNSKWYDAAQRVMVALRKQQLKTKIPGMWPTEVNARTKDFTQHDTFTLGASFDSLYEYLPKTYALVGGQIPFYKEMYQRAMDAAVAHTIFRPPLPHNKDVLVAATAVHRLVENHPVIDLVPEHHHLSCFAGGMFALGGRIFENETHLDIAHKLVDGCLWSARANPLGIMPERVLLQPCAPGQVCAFSETAWKSELQKQAGAWVDVESYIQEHSLSPGMVDVPDKRYLLRPEIVESVFVLYRATGREDLLDAAWAMFEAIQRSTRTGGANAAILDVTAGAPRLMDEMDSAWVQTLKYFFLLFSESGVVSLDEWVFNSQAHPVRRALPVARPVLGD